MDGWKMEEQTIVRSYEGGGGGGGHVVSCTLVLFPSNLQGTPENATKRIERFMNLVLP
jgi:hypothetical protein